MRKNLKYSLGIGGSLILIATIGYFVRKKLAKNKLNKPCKGKRCADNIDGKLIYSLGGKTNIRKSTSVDEDNLIGISYSTPLGSVISQLNGTQGYVWYKIQLTEPIGSETVGYVREDVITTKK